MEQKHKFSRYLKRKYTGIKTSRAECCYVAKGLKVCLTNETIYVNETFQEYVMSFCDLFPAFFVKGSAFQDDQYIYIYKIRSAL